MSTGSKTVRDLEEANLLLGEDQFIFLQNTTKKTKRISRKNFFNTPGLIVKGKFIDPEGNDVGLAAAAATNDAALALSTANGAQATADGKNRIFYQNTAPTSPTGGYNLINGDLWFDTGADYAMYTWNTSLPGANKWEVREIADLSIARINAGKITAGFIGAQVIAINGTDVYNNPVGAGGYIESTSFVLTWPGANYVNVKQYNAAATNLGKSVASDVVQVKVLQSDGSYKLFRALQDQVKSAGQIAPPASGSNAHWTEITGVNIPTVSIPISSTESKNIQNFGFRISSNGFAEFSGALFRGAIIANEGYFGDKVNAVRVDDDGLTMGNYGRIKSAGIGYNGTDFTSSSGSGGFFLGNTQAENQEELYQFFIGNPSANFLRWNGTDLIINGKIGLPPGGNADTDAGLEITSGFGIRRSSKDKVLTITGGNGNGITYGAQIDLVGTEFVGASGNAEGQLILSAGYDSTLSTSSADGCIVFRTSRESANANIGVQRLRVDLDGTVRVINAGNAYAGAPDSGAGKFVVPNVITIGGSSSTTIFGNHNGYIYIKQSDNKTRIAMEAVDGVMNFLDGTVSNDVSISLNATDGTVQAAQYTSTSSKRFKKKIKNLKNGLEKISKLRPVVFDWKNKEIKNDIGLIAEEVNEIIPNLVGFNNKGEIIGIDYGKLTPILIQAVKELSLEVERLKNKIK